MIVLGSDIGTTRSKAACIDETGRPQIILNRRGDGYTPSAIYFEDGLRPIVGAEALSEGAIHPQHVLTCFKRSMGKPDVLYTDATGRAYRAVDLQALLIRSLCDQVEQRFNAKVDEAVISVPANFKDHQKQATIDAAAQAGLSVISLVHEPTAAGIAYAIEKHKDQRSVIYDLGGGTFDVSVLETHGNEIRVLGSTGRERLGGEDFNERLQNYLLECFKREHRFCPTAEDDPLFIHDLREKTEQTKVALSEKSKANVVIGCRGRQTIVEVTRAHFEELTRDLRDETMKCTSEAIAGLGLTWQDIDAMIMVGGSARIPAIQSALADLTGIAPRCDIEPDRAVAYGAALKCAIDLAARGTTLMIGGRAIPAPKAFVKEVTSHSMGCCVVERDGGLSNAVILPKGTRIPTVKTDRFALQYEEQTEARIEVLQGEEGAQRDACLVIGEIVLKNLPTETKRSKRIEVTYRIDDNGMIRAQGKDIVSGQTVGIDIDYRAASAGQQQAA